MTRLSLLPVGFTVNTTCPPPGVIRGVPFTCLEELIRGVPFLSGIVTFMYMSLWLKMFWGLFASSFSVPYDSYSYEQSDKL